jgi:hypothetical protein
MTLHLLKPYDSQLTPHSDAAQERKNLILPIPLLNDNIGRLIQVVQGMYPADVPGSPLIFHQHVCDAVQHYPWVRFAEWYLIHICCFCGCFFTLSLKG